MSFSSHVGNEFLNKSDPCHSRMYCLVVTLYAGINHLELIRPKKFLWWYQHGWDCTL